MSKELDDLLREYIDDTKKYHSEYHEGRIEECGYTGCRLAVDLMSGRVRDDTYRAIVENSK